MNEQKRFVAYVDREDLKKLKVKLASLEISMSEWMRKTIKNFVEQNHRNPFQRVD